MSYQENNSHSTKQIIDANIVIKPSEYMIRFYLGKCFFNDSFEWIRFLTMTAINIINNNNINSLLKSFLIK